MKLFICGAVPDILREFQTKLERIGHEVVGAQEYRPSRPYSPPAETEGVIVGTDQSGHAATDSIVTTCKQRGLPYALGELRKWSLIYPRMVQVGIVSNQAPEPEEEEEEMANGADSKDEALSQDQFREKVKEFTKYCKRANVDICEYHFSDGHARFEGSFKTPKMVLDF
jgi:hypothetical protein